MMKDGIIEKCPVCGADLMSNGRCCYDHCEYNTIQEVKEIANKWEHRVKGKEYWNGFHHAITEFEERLTQSKEKDYNERN